MRTRQEDKILKLFNRLKNSIKAVLLYYHITLFYLSLSRSYKAYFPTLSCLIFSFVAGQLSHSWPPLCGNFKTSLPVMCQ